MENNINDFSDMFVFGVAFVTHKKFLKIITLKLSIRNFTWRGDAVASY